MLVLMRFVILCWVRKWMVCRVGVIFINGLLLMRNRVRWLGFGNRLLLMLMVLSRRCMVLVVVGFGMLVVGNGIGNVIFLILVMFLCFIWN